MDQERRAPGGLEHAGSSPRLLLLPAYGQWRNLGKSGLVVDEKTSPQTHRSPLNHVSGGYAVIKSLLRGAWRVHLRGRSDQNQRELEVL
jgi:hypothetical protein